MGFEQIDFIDELAEDFFLVRGEGRGQFPFCNGFLIADKEVLLIDTGMGAERISEIDRRKRIDQVIFTHSHPDHILNWHLLKDRHLLFPKETPNTVHDLEQLGRRFAGNGEGGARWTEIFGRRMGLVPLRLPDSTFSDGDVLDLGGTKLEAIHTPGHLNDHYCFLDRKSGILITADIDFSSFGPWYCNPESDIAVFHESIRKVMSVPCSMVCPSHGAPVDGRATDHFEEFIEGFKRHQRKLLKICRHPITLEEITAKSPFFKGKFPDEVIQREFEGNMIRKILSGLEKEGIVQNLNGRFRHVSSRI